MENVTLEIAETEIETQVARCRELDRERRALADRIEKAEAARESVKESIYRKVRSEYDTRLAAVERELGPIVEALEKSHAALRTEMAEIERQDEELRDRLDELAFRARVGELDDRMFEGAHAPIENQRERLQQRRKALTRVAALLGAADAPPSDPVQRSNSVPAAPASPPAEPPVQVEEAGDFVDPTEWLEEFVPDEPGAEQSPQGEGADPLADFADPNDEPAAPSRDAPPIRAAEPTHGLAPRDAAEPARYAPASALPILTITSGPGAGRRLPLLPVTMTLGREVDNNIELKDKDVARYHARISCESGKYVIQDLEGSSGTFVNGESVTRAALAAGDVIRIGSTELSLELGQTAA